MYSLYFTERINILLLFFCLLRFQFQVTSCAQLLRRTRCRFVWRLSSCGHHPDIVNVNCLINKIMFCKSYFNIRYMMILFIWVNEKGTNGETNEDQCTYRNEGDFSHKYWRLFLQLPKRVTILTEIFLAMRAPQITARPVQMMWPRTPPRQTPATSLIPAITIVANCDLEIKRGVVY